MSGPDRGWPLNPAPELRLETTRLPADKSLKVQAYVAIKEALAKIDVYRSSDPIMLDERQLSKRLGISRTPIREALVMLGQEGLLRTVPRRGIVVVRKTKREIVEMIQAWAALESIAARLTTRRASDSEIAALRVLFEGFTPGHIPPDRLDEYSAADISFHQSLIHLSGSKLLVAMTDNLFLHVKPIRLRAMFDDGRAERSIRDHMEIIQALEARDAELAERLVRTHTLLLGEHVEKHVDLD